MNTHEAIEALRLKAFETNAPSDRHAYYTTLSKAFQNGELVVRPSSPGKDGGQEVEAVGCPGDKCEHFWEEAPCCNGWRPQPASTALVERLGLAWAAVGHHEGIEISVHADAADTWNALCAIRDPLALSALSASQSTKGDADA